MILVCDIPFLSDWLLLGTCTMAAALPVAGVTNPLSPVMDGDSSAKVPDYSLHFSSIPDSGRGSPVLQLSSDGLPVELDPKVEAG